MNKRIINAILILIIFHGLISCSNKLQPKGFAVTPAENISDSKIDGIPQDSLIFPTRPSSVLLTGIPQYRLATIYKVNYRKDKTTFIGSNDFYSNYQEEESEGNRWHDHLMPGFEAVSGYNMVNVSHYDTVRQRQKNFFEKPVLIRTLYYPSFSKDTLNYKLVNRNYFMISVYDEDTNKDGFINVKDLRRFYLFDIYAENKKALISTNYSVYKSEYDQANDFVYIFAKLDENKNGQIEELEPIHIFWIDLKNPERTGRKY